MAQPPLSKTIEDDGRPTQQSSGRQLIAEPILKPGDKIEDTLRDNRGAIRVPSPDPSIISIDDTIVHTSVHVPFHGERHALPSLAPPKTLKGKIHASWTANKGLALVLIAQMFGTLMNVATRILEMEGNNGKTFYVNQRFNSLKICR